MATDIAPRPSGWLDQLAGAASPEEVVRVACEYLATWTPEEIACLPRTCRPPRRLKFPEEVVDYAFVLVKEHLDGSPDSDAVSRMANFFAEASWRVAAAMSAAEPADADNDGAY